MEGENRDEENIEIHADRELEEGALVIDKNNRNPTVANEELSTNTDDTVEMTPAIKVLMEKEGISAEEANLALKKHGTVSAVIRERQARETEEKKWKVEMDALKKEVEEQKKKLTNYRQDLMKHEISSTSQSSKRGKKKKKSRGNRLDSRSSNNSHHSYHSNHSRRSNGSREWRGRSEFDLPPPLPRSRDRTPIRDSGRVPIHVDNNMCLPPDEDVVDAPDGAGVAAAASGARMRLNALNRSTLFKNWAKVELLYLKASKRSEEEKKAAILSALMPRYYVSQKGGVDQR